MARFIGRLQGSRGAVSRLGGTASGISARVQGWNVGVRVYGQSREGKDVFWVYATGGSNGRPPESAVAVISQDETGAVVTETPEQYDNRMAKAATKREPAYRPLTADEVAALTRYAAEKGRTWKSSLRHDWMTAALTGPLHALRNSHGPSWLVEVKL